MVDWIALLVSHGLIAIAFWRLMSRADLDDESAPSQRHRPPGFGQSAVTPERPFAAPSGPDPSRA